MNTPRYWSRATVDPHGRPTDDPYGFIGVGWSDVSEADAQQHAARRAARIAQRFADRQDPEALREQYYADRPLREPVIDELEHDGRRVAVITQNAYGAYILNAAEAMFIDIDLPAPAKPAGVFGKMFGKKPPPATPDDPLDPIRRAVEAHPGMGLKLYRTPNGYRGLVTDRPYAPASDEALRVLRAFDADALYVTLCQAQQCFRARLTPKPWRIGMDGPPRAFPFTDAAKHNAFEGWKQHYDQRIAGYAACAAVSDHPWGSPTVHPAVAPVLAWHDQLACNAGLPLA